MSQLVKNMLDQMWKGQITRWTRLENGVGEDSPGVVSHF